LDLGKAELVGCGGVGPEDRFGSGGGRTGGTGSRDRASDLAVGVGAERGTGDVGAGAERPDWNVEAGVGGGLGGVSLGGVAGGGGRDLGGEDVDTGAL
jgi:hypothetical protein